MSMSRGNQQRRSIVLMAAAIGAGLLCSMPGRSRAQERSRPGGSQQHPMTVSAVHMATRHAEMKEPTAVALERAMQRAQALSAAGRTWQPIREITTPDMRPGDLPPESRDLGGFGRVDAAGTTRPLRL